jgi:hypothetical protein
MGRKYSFGKYSANSYDLGGGVSEFAAHLSVSVNLHGEFDSGYILNGSASFVVNAHGNFVLINEYAGALNFQVNLQGRFKRTVTFYGELTVPINLGGRLSSNYKLTSGVIHVPINITSYDIIGPFWGGEVPDGSFDWVPIPDKPPEIWAPISAMSDIWAPITKPHPVFET